MSDLKNLQAISNKLISDTVAYRTYAKFISHLGRRESLAETINRNMNMHLDRFPGLSKDIVKSYQKVHALEVMPSMRALQFSGDPILKNNARQYNCSFVNVSDERVFGEILFLLLSGVGVGFSVQNRHIKNLPRIQKPREEGYFVCHDSISGWAQALDMLMDAYFLGRIKPQFDFGNIRPKGAYLVTTGASAPGPEPLKKMLELVESKLKVAVGRALTSIECHDIICIISDAVLAGGIRRAALISLFDRDDKDMLYSKSGEWWNHAPWRARSNNSAVLPRGEVTQEEFNSIFEICQKSGSGEPGFYWTNNLDLGTNPCCEISLNSMQFCNLTTINQTGIKSEKDFLNRVYAASLIGTLQASYTDFGYLRKSWRETTEKEALLGVSFTGIADAGSIVTPELLQKGAKLVLEVNEKYAKKMGINVAARTTAIKPEGSSSCVLSSSSGIHARHSEYYIRRIRMNKDDALAVYFKNTIPELVEDDVFSSTGIVLSIPQMSPKDAITRHKETAFSLLDRTLSYRKNWVEEGYRYGDNHHNVSVTISVKEEEWDQLKLEMWNHRDSYSGISLLPFDGGTYTQAPFTDCTEEEFIKMSKLIKDVDLKQIKEERDTNNRIESISCSGGACEIV
jgi:ribonucleoside-diphosphate reductase alpha chain